MHISNDFHGYGLQELMENQVLFMPTFAISRNRPCQIVAFDAELKKKDDDDALKRTWACISALALWLNEVHMGPFVGNENGAKVKALSGLMGSALLRALAAVDHADELKADSTFIDIPLVISSFLEWSSDLPDYDIDGEAVAWRSHAASYFRKGKLAADKGSAGTEKLVEKANPSDESGLPEKTDKDPWKWTAKLRAYKSRYGPKIGGRKYDITKMTRKQRAGYSYAGKDPLAAFPEEALKNDGLEM